MKIFIITISAFLSIVLLGCNSQNENEPKLVKIGNTNELEQIITEHNDIIKSDPATSLNAIIDFYKLTNYPDTNSKETPIPIYVNYAVDTWKMDQQTFEITFASQRVNPNDGNLYEYRIDLVYNPDEFEGENEFFIKLESGVTIEEFKEKIKSSNGFKKAINQRPNRIIIIEEKI